MKFPRFTVRRLMILVVVLGSGVFAVRCFKTREYAQKRSDDIEWFIRGSTDYVKTLKDYDEESPLIQKQESILARLRSKRSQFEHVRRYPWHPLPFGDNLGPTPNEQDLAEMWFPR
jgi:hypothetical protein